MKMLSKAFPTPNIKASLTVTYIVVHNPIMSKNRKLMCFMNLHIFIINTIM